MHPKPKIIKTKMIKFYHVKGYLDYGYVEMEGEWYDKNNGIIRGLICEGEPMSPYLYFKRDFSLTEKGAISMGNKIIEKEIKKYEKHIEQLKKRLIKN